MPGPLYLLYCTCSTALYCALPHSTALYCNCSTALYCTCSTSSPTPHPRLLHTTPANYIFTPANHIFTPARAAAAILPLAADAGGRAALGIQEAIQQVIQLPS